MYFDFISLDLLTPELNLNMGYSIVNVAGRPGFYKKSVLDISSNYFFIFYSLLQPSFSHDKDLFIKAIKVV